MVSYADQPKLLHAYIHNKKCQVALWLLCGQLVDDSCGMANILVDPFTSVFEIHVPPASASSQGFDGMLTNIEINMEKVYSVLTKLDVGSAMDPDSINLKLLRECAMKLASPLAMIFLSGGSR